MNERLLELAGQAANLSPHESVKMQKFAELIVQECMQLTQEEENRYYDMNEDLFALIMENFREIIKEHFGVE
jgi:hypothetical protein